MHPLIPEVHLFLCFDSRVSPGAILHLLDIARAQDWRQEIVLVCDIQWKPYVNVDQPVIFIDRERFFKNQGEQGSQLNVEILESLLEQLDNFEIRQVTQVGDLQWGRWFKSYLQQMSDININEIKLNNEPISAIEVVNRVSEELNLDLETPRNNSFRSPSVYIDPYVDGELCETFLNLLKGVKANQIPDWVNIVCQPRDQGRLKKLGFVDCVVDVSETEMQLFNQSVLCFSDQSPFALTSRAYNVAIIGVEANKSFFVPGDMSIECKRSIHILELFNILAYWKAKRLKELAFQWLNMEIEIECVESFNGILVKRNLLSYSSDLQHCQYLLSYFLNASNKFTKSEYRSIIKEMRRKLNSDVYSLSFSLKLLMMITERMLASASCGERLFQRLGSDYHRIIIGEALVESMIEYQSKDSIKLDIRNQIQDFNSFLIQLDFHNDSLQTDVSGKEFS